MAKRKKAAERDNSTIIVKINGYGVYEVPVRFWDPRSAYHSAKIAGTLLFWRYGEDWIVTGGSVAENRGVITDRETLEAIAAVPNYPAHD